MTTTSVAVAHAPIAIIAGLPLLGSLLAYLVGLSRRDLAGWIATGASTLAFGWVLVLLGKLGEGIVLEQTLFTWFQVAGWTIDFTFRFDQLTAVMCLVVTGIGSLIHLYSISYMAEDDGRHRFFAYLNLFMFSMLMLVLGGNLLVLFVGWEGVGLCSYLLIGFWFKNLAYAAAGRKAFIVNRIGDAGMLVGMFLLLSRFGTLDFVQLSQAIAGHEALLGFCTLVGACLFIGATGKSAQIPLFVWLPDAMAGPTPVSALIHAATMVTAGVYLMARMWFLFDLAPLVMGVVLAVAVVTAFVAATTALVQNDIKKVLAYSTVSQLGFMFMAAAVGAYWVAIFHLVTHAFFKACLFLGAGSVIHGCHHEQDMRKMGGLMGLMPVTFATYLISTLAIAGLFPFAGYQSKHAILGALQEASNPYLGSALSLAGTLATITAFLTAFYMTRSVALTFLGHYRGGHHTTDDHNHAHHGGHHETHVPHESPWKMTVPLIVLACLATVGGLWLQHALPEYLHTVLPRAHGHESASLIDNIKGSAVGIAGVLLALVLYTKLQLIPGLVSRLFAPLTQLFAGKWYFDELYQLVIVEPLAKVAALLFSVVDQGIVDGTVNGSAAIVDINGEWLRGIQTGQVRHYAMVMFLCTVVVVVFCFVL